MVFRFANGFVEPLWSRDHIDHVQITVAETVGVEQRGKSYDATGALRDMVPNHLFQLLSLIAMEPPISRTLVTPLAISKGKNQEGRAESQRECTCESQRPGIRNLPLASRMWVAAGSFLPEGVILMMRPCATRTVLLGFSVPV